MKKIMFNDMYGLTDAVLQGRKTMTRRQADVRWAAGDIHDNPVPKYKVGEVLAVAQRYRDLAWDNRLYKKIKLLCPGEMPWNALKGWDNKMFVKADLMPHHIRITDVKVEQLQNISDEDIMKEGIAYIAGGGDGVRFGGTYNVFALNPIVAFAVLIDKVSGNGTWRLNPWVFAYSFELVK